MKRTPELKPSMLSDYSVVRFTDSLAPSTFPSDESRAIFDRPLTRTQTYFSGRAPASDIRDDRFAHGELMNHVPQSKLSGERWTTKSEI